MKSSRLIRILLLLQLNGQMSAVRLAEELEVSVRTVYRDAEALMMAGVPIYSTPGPTGGYRLVDGWQTRLTGLTTEEAEALFLSGLPGPAAELGLGTVVAVAGLKVENALPPELRGRTARIRERFVLDAPGWFSGQDPVPHLAGIADAVWNGRKVAVRYERWAGEVDRVLEPLGIVLKGGLWYLVARAEEEIHTYRVSRVHELRVLDEVFDRPVDFDLEAFWEANAEGYEEAMYPETARVRISPAGMERLAVVRGSQAAHAALLGSGPVHDLGWREVDLPVELEPAQAARDLLAYGTDVEVIGPAAIRRALRDELLALDAMYRSDGASSHTIG